MSKKTNIAFGIAIIAFLAIFFGIVVVGHHYIMAYYYWVYGGVSEVYPHYYENSEALLIAVIGSVSIWLISYGVMSLIEKLLRIKGVTKCIRNGPQSGMPQ